MGPTTTSANTDAIQPVPELNNKELYITSHYWAYQETKANRPTSPSFLVNGSVVRRCRTLAAVSEEVFQVLSYCRM